MEIRRKRKKKVRQFNKVGIEIQTDRPESSRAFPAVKIKINGKRE